VLRRAAGGAGHCHRQVHAQGRPDPIRIGAYARKKDYTRCLEIFEEMVDAGCYPDAGTAKVLLAACSDERQVEQVTAIVRSMHKDAKTLFTL
jgi:pentatricopeptide repeat protein